MILSIVTAIVGVICLNMMIVPFQAAVIGHVDPFIVLGIFALSVLAGILVNPKKCHYTVIVALATLGLGCILAPFRSAFNLLGTAQVMMMLAGIIFVSYTMALINDLKGRKI
jgi:hypothetical protein